LMKSTFCGTGTAGRAGWMLSTRPHSTIFMMSESQASPRRTCIRF
jgi:hypothetical protein